MLFPGVIAFGIRRLSACGMRRYTDHPNKEVRCIQNPRLPALVRYVSYAWRAGMASMTAGFSALTGT